MKNTIEKIALFLVLLFAVGAVNAQIQNVWVGGMPGRPIDWDVAANWSLQQVPTEFHDVVIPNTATTTFSYPVIDNEVEIHSLRIESGAKLVILETGKLQLEAVGATREVLANAGEIDNRSRNAIEFHEPVVLKNTAIASTKKF